MRYFGGKAKVGKEISKILNSANKKNQIFLSPFIGGGWVEQYIKGKKILCDKHPYLIEMYKQLQNDWLPPTELSKEEYEYVKNNLDKEPHLTGFVGFGCSFAGKWFGGYAKDNTGRNYCLNAYNSIQRKIKNGLLEKSKFICCDYQELTPNNMLVYCDPPYKGVTQYDKKIVGEFDSEVFWEVIREWSKNNTVFISEYSAPEDFKEIWRKETKTDIRDKENKKQDRIERLFKLGE